MANLDLSKYGILLKSKFAISFNDLKCWYLVYNLFP